MTAVIIIAVVLILAILFLLIRIQTLISVMKGTYQQRVGTSNKVNAILFPIFFIAGTFAFYWLSVVASENFLPEASSIHGIRTDNMFWITMAILIFAFIFTNIFLFFFAWKYQYKEGNSAYFYPENHKLEIVWTVIPAIVLSILVFYGWKEWTYIMRPADGDEEVVEILGMQFAWKARYPGVDGILGDHAFANIDDENVFGVNFADTNALDDFSVGEIHLPKGKEVYLSIRANDVLHSVFAPHFRLKMDAVPGMPTRFIFTPTKTTQEMRDELGNPKFNYEIACAEVCGRSHFAMRMVVVVEEPEQYEEWKKNQRTMLATNPEKYGAMVPAEYKNRIPKPEEEDELPMNDGVSDRVDDVEITTDADGLEGNGEELQDDTTNVDGGISMLTK